MSLEKTESTSTLPLAMDKLQGRLVALILYNNSSRKAENSRFKPAVLNLKKTLCNNHLDLQ